MSLTSAAFTAAYHDTCEDSADDTVEIDTHSLAEKLVESGEYDMAIRLRRSSRPPRPQAN